MMCCGHDHATEFCPHCGSKLRTDPLASLLKHIRDNQAAQETTLRRFGERGGATSERHANWFNKRRKVVAKWKAWGDAVERLMAASESESTPANADR